VIGGSSVIVAVATAALLAALVAVTVTVCAVATVAGAEYNPLLLIVPAPVAGLIAHVTEVFVAFATVAVNYCVAPP
jgi:hypothetical protein